ELTDLRTGHPFTLSSLRGKPVLVTFWSTWCAPCRAQMSELQKKYDAVKGQVEFVGISTGDRCYGPQYIKRFIAANKYRWIFGHADGTTLLSSYSKPTSYFLDKDGVIRAVYIGVLNATTLDRNLQKIVHR